MQHEQKQLQGYTLQKASSIPAVEPRQPLVEGFLYSTDTMFLYAPSGGYKSMVAINLAVAVAEGSKFMDRATQQGRVLYVDGELSQYSFKERLDLFGKPEALDILSECYQDQCGRDRAPIDITDEKWRRSVLGAVRKNGYKLVVLDNIRTLTSDLNENDASDITQLNNLVKSLRHLGSAVLVVHHTRKESNSEDDPVYAGSTNFLTVYNTAIGIKRVGKAGIQFIVEKDREYSVDDTFREYVWKLSDEAGVGFVRHDGFREEAQHLLALWDDICSGKFTTRKELCAYAKSHYRLKWSKGNSTDIKAVHRLMAEEDVGMSTFEAFDAAVTEGIQKAKKIRDAEESGEPLTAEQLRALDVEVDY